jgi:hypothetical protein
MTTFYDQGQGAAGYLADLLEGVAPQWRQAFQHFVETGEAEDDFLNYLNEDERGQQAVEMAFNRQAAGFEGLAAELKTTSVPNRQREAEPLKTAAAAISTRIAAVVEVALRAPSAQRDELVEKSAAELAASMPLEERNALQEVVRSLDDKLAKVAGA